MVHLPYTVQKFSIQGEYEYILTYHFSTYPVEEKWHIMDPGVGSENIVYFVAKKNPNVGILSNVYMVLQRLYL